MADVLVSVHRLAALQLGIQRQRRQPRLGRVPERADGSAGIGEEQPRPVLVVAEHVGDAPRPARAETRRQPRLERLNRPARLEPRDAVRVRHAQHRRPGSLVRDLDLACRFDVRADPGLRTGAIHGYAQGSSCQ